MGEEEIIVEEMEGLVPLDMADEELIEITKKSEVDQIDEYVSQVGENLKRNIRWNKETILIGIREDILKRIELEESRNRDQSITGKKIEGRFVKQALQGYGDPEAVARRYDDVNPRSILMKLALPIIVVVNLVLVVYLGRGMWGTFEYISEWNTNWSYVVLGMVTFLLVSAAFFLIMKLRRGEIVHQIRKEVRVFIVVGFLLTSVIAGIVGSGRMELKRDWEEDREESSREIPSHVEEFIGERRLFNNGSMYTISLEEEKGREGNYSLMLKKWGRNLTEVVNTTVIPISYVVDEEDTMEVYYIRTSAYFIHAVFRFRYEPYPGLRSTRKTILYVFTTFEGPTIRTTELSRKSFYGSHVSMRAQGSTAIFISYYAMENETWEDNISGGDYPELVRIDFMNVSWLSCEDGILMNATPMWIWVPLSEIGPWNRHFWDVGYFPNESSISMTMRFRRRMEPSRGEHCSSYYFETYFVQFSKSGSLISGPTLLFNGSRIDENEHNLYGNTSEYRIMNGYQNNYLVELYRNDGTEWWEEFLHINIGSNEKAGPANGGTRKIVSYDQNSVRMPYLSSFITMNGTIFSSYLTMERSDDKIEVFLQVFSILRNGSLIIGRSIPLDGIALFDTVEDWDSDDFEILASMFVNDLYSNGTRSYFFNSHAVYELKVDDYMGMWQESVVITDDDGVRIVNYGYDPNPPETKGTLFMILIVSCIIGLALPTSLYDLGKRRLLIQEDHIPIRP